jgi:3-hydroxyacyl-[acyl-carrier-protein] dehydratase
VSENEKVIYDTIAIQALIPHRYPFLLVDKVIEFLDNDRIVAIKNVTINEPFFNGHFPGKPVMPGVLILEAMAQAGAILAIESKDGVDRSKTVYLVSCDNVRFKKMVVPGDTLRIEMTSVKKRRPFWMMEGTVTVEDKVVASAQLCAAEA